MKRQTSFLPVFGLVVAMVIWGSSYIAMKYALQAYHPLLVVFGRMSIAAAVFLLFYKKFTPLTYTKGDWRYLLLMALCEPCCYFLFESYSLKYTTASQSGMVAALLPALVAVVAGFCLKERTTMITYGGLGVAVAGILLISSQSMATASAPNPLLGNFLELIAMCFAAGYTTLSRYLSARYSPLFLTAMQMFVGTLFFTPAVAFLSSRPPATWPLIPTIAIVYLGVFVSFGAYSLFNYGLRHVSASQASAYVNLVPVFAVIFGRIVLDEKMTVLQIGGMCLVLVGVWVSSVVDAYRRPRLKPLGLNPQALSCRPFRAKSDDVEI